MLSGAFGLLKLSQINNTMDMSKVGGAFPGVNGSNERKFNVKTWEISTIKNINKKARYYKIKNDFQPSMAKKC